MKCVFLDRDGVLNKDYVDYVYTLDKLEILPGTQEAISALKRAGYLVILITNQSGIAKGIYTHEHVKIVHEEMQKIYDHQIDDIYYAPGHPVVSESLSRKPGSLMFEKAIAKYGIDPKLSWMVGDKERDLVPAKKLGIKTIQVDHDDSKMADYKAKDLSDAMEIIFG